LPTRASIYKGNVHSKLAAARTAIENRNHPPSENSQPPPTLPAPAQEIDVPDWRALLWNAYGCGRIKRLLVSQHLHRGYECVDFYTWRPTLLSMTGC
jgi:hypothetical protein